MNTWRRDLNIEMWTAGFKYSWRKMDHGGGRTRHSWMETSSLRLVFHRVQKAQVKVGK